MVAPILHVAFQEGLDFKCCQSHWVICGAEGKEERRLKWSLIQLAHHSNSLRQFNVGVPCLICLPVFRKQNRWKKLIDVHSHMKMPEFKDVFSC